MLNYITNPSGADEAKVLNDLHDDNLIVLTMPMTGTDDTNKKMEAIQAKRQREMHMPASTTNRPTSIE